MCAIKIMRPLYVLVQLYSAVIGVQILYFIDWVGRRTDLQAKTMIHTLLILHNYCIGLLYVLGSEIDRLMIHNQRQVDRISLVPTPKPYCRGADPRPFPHYTPHDLGNAVSDN